MKPSTVHLLQQGLRGSNAQFLSKAALHDPDNPITHSKTGERTLMIQSCASGHQTSNSNSRSGGGSWALHRNAKLSIQAQAKSSNIFEGVICYINGYTGTDAAADHPAVGLGGDDDVEDLSTGDRGHTYGVTERTWSNEMIKDAVESGGGVVRCVTNRLPIKGRPSADHQLTRGSFFRVEQHQPVCTTQSRPDLDRTFSFKDSKGSDRSTLVFEQSNQVCRPTMDRRISVGRT